MIFFSGNLLAILMDASGGGLEDLEELYPQSRSEETSVKLYLAIAIGMYRWKIFLKQLKIV